MHICSELLHHYSFQFTLITLISPLLSFSTRKNKREIAPEQLKSTFLTVVLCIKVEHADAEPRSSSPDERQAVSLLSTELALAWTTTVSVNKLFFHRIIDSSYRRNSPSFSHLAPDLHWVSAPTLSFSFFTGKLRVFLLFFSSPLLLSTQLPSLLWLGSERTGRATRLHFLSEPTG